MIGRWSRIASVFRIETVFESGGRLSEQAFGGLFEGGFRGELVDFKDLFQRDTLLV